MCSRARIAMTGMKSHFAVISNSSKQAPSQAFSIVRQRGCYVTGPRGPVALTTSQGYQPKLL